VELQRVVKGGWDLRLATGGKLISKFIEEWFVISSVVAQ
jgi:hypothetical protein